MKVVQILKMIHEDGWYQVRQSGSHRQFHHTEKKELLPLQENQVMS